MHKIPMELATFHLMLDKEKHKWISTWLTSEEYLIAAVSVTTLQMITMPILFILHFYRLHRGGPIKSKLKARQDKESPLRFRYMIIDNVSLAAIAFSFVSAIITTSNYASAFGHKTCRLMTITQNICWLLTKISIYIVILLRLQCAFWGSTFQISHAFNHLCYVIITLFTFIIGVVTALPYPIGVDSIPLNGTGFCLLIIPVWLILAPLIFDILCAILSMYLFIKPIRQIIGYSGENAAELRKLLVKYILMSTIAVFSNLFSSIFFTVTDILIFTYCDIFINPICLILMQIHHDDIYKALCKHCHRGLAKVVRFPEASVSRERTMTDIQSRNSPRPPPPKRIETVLSASAVGSSSKLPLPGTSPTPVSGVELAAHVLKTPPLSPSVSMKEVQSGSGSPSVSVEYLGGSLSANVQQNHD